MKLKIIFYRFCLTLFLFANTSFAFEDDDFEEPIIKSRPVADYQIIKDTCVIEFDFMEFEDIEKLKTQDEEAFYINADDANYYQSQARQYLQDKGIKTVFTSSRYLILVDKKGKEIYVDRKKAKRWIFFNADSGLVKMKFPIDITS